MSGISTREKKEFNVDNEFVDRFLNTVNTILVGQVESISGNKATINIANNYAKLMPNGDITYVNYGQITTNFATPSLFQYVPSEGDKVVILVIQSDSQGFLNQNSEQYPSRFNVWDSIIIPVSIFYSNESTVTVGKSTLNMTVLAELYQANVNNFRIINQSTSDNLLAIIADTFAAIGAVTIDGQTIDELTGGVVSTNSAKLLEFS